MFKLDFETRVHGLMPAMYWVNTKVLPGAGTELAAKICSSGGFSARHRFLHFVVLLRSLGFQHPSVQTALVSFLASDDVQLQGTAIVEIQAAARREFLQTHPGEMSNLSDADQQVLLSGVLAVKDSACSPFKLCARAILGDPLAFEEALSFLESVPPDTPRDERDLEWYVQSLLRSMSIRILSGMEPSARVRIKPENEPIPTSVDALIGSLRRKRGDGSEENRPGDQRGSSTSHR